MEVTAATLQSLRFEHRALLDVDLEEAQRVVADGRFADLCGIEPEGADCGFQRHALCIFEFEQGSIEASGNRAAADERHAKAHALFFAEGNDFDGQRQLEFLRDLCTFERQRDAEDAVEGAGIGHGVNVRAEDQALAACVWRLPQAAQIAHRVDTHRHAERLHAAAQQVHALRVRAA